MATMTRSSNACRKYALWKYALACAALQLGACASPYALPPSVSTAVGQRPSLVCAHGEAQLCRDHGARLKCACVPF